MKAGFVRTFALIAGLAGLFATAEVAGAAEAHKPTAGPTAKCPARCCPQGWDLYTCQEQQGGQAMSCHNPKMECASSKMCGEGCDFEVDGRCHCVQTHLCVVSSHWDPTYCQCVPDVCVDTKLCIIGSHWDPVLCSCIPDACK